jgi:hypothetical protein
MRKWEATQERVGIGRSAATPCVGLSALGFVGWLHTWSFGISMHIARLQRSALSTEPTLSPTSEYLRQRRLGMSVCMLAG